MKYSDYRSICNSNYLIFHTEAVFDTLILPIWSYYKYIYKSPELFIKAIDKCDIPALVELAYYSKVAQTDHKVAQ